MIMEKEMNREEAREKIISLFVKELEGVDPDEIKSQVAEIASDYAAFSSVCALNTMMDKAERIFKKKNQKEELRDRIKNM